MQKKNLKKYLKHMKFYPILKKELNMISMVTKHLIKHNLEQHLKIFLLTFSNHSKVGLVVEIFLRRYLAALADKHLIEEIELPQEMTFK
ncbi:Uncharacterised protein [Chlamydia abortus]|nr:Uncharacterised protein [Chlamydia abortus]